MYHRTTQISRRAVSALLVALSLSPATPSIAQSIREEKVARVKVEIVDQTDRFTGSRIVGAKRGLPLDKTGWLTTLSLTPSVLVQDGKSPILYAAVYYSGYGWAFLNGTAYFIVDGQRFVATGTDSSGRREVSLCGGSTGCIMEEVERIIIPRDLAAALSNAKDAEVKITGTKGALTGRLTEKHIAYFREIVARYEAMGGSYLESDTDLLGQGAKVSDKSPASAADPQLPKAAVRMPEQEPHQLDPAKRCDACARIGKP